MNSANARSISLWLLFTCFYTADASIVPKGIPQVDLRTTKDWVYVESPWLGRFELREYHFRNIQTFAVQGVMPEEMLERFSSQGYATSLTLFSYEMSLPLRLYYACSIFAAVFIVMAIAIFALLLRRIRSQISMPRDQDRC